MPGPGPGLVMSYAIDNSVRSQGSVWFGCGWRRKDTGLVAGCERLGVERCGMARGFGTPAAELGARKFGEAVDVVS